MSTANDWQVHARMHDPGLTDNLLHQSCKFSDPGLTNFPDLAVITFKALPAGWPANFIVKMTFSLYA
jgi:hypothetical protein